MGRSLLRQGNRKRFESCWWPLSCLCARTLGVRHNACPIPFGNISSTAQVTQQHGAVVLYKRLGVVFWLSIQFSEIWRMTYFSGKCPPPRPPPQPRSSLLLDWHSFAWTRPQLVLYAREERLAEQSPWPSRNRGNRPPPPGSGRYGHAGCCLAHTVSC